MPTKGKAKGALLRPEHSVCALEAKARSRVMVAALAIAMSALLALATAIPATSALAYEQREQIVSSGHGWTNPSYLVVHETANPGASAWNHVLYWRNNQPSIEMAHYVMELDGSVVYHTQADNTIAWHVGNGNAYTVGIELAHAISQAQFDSQWAEAVKWCGDYLSSRGWGVDRMLSHHEAAMRWGGSDHTDPDGYFASYGRSWAQFEQAVADYMGTGVAPSGGTTSTAPGNGAPGYAGTGFGGTYTCMVDALNVRSGAGLGYPVVASYGRGETVNLDDYYVISDGYVWGWYMSYSGHTRYVAVGRATGQVEPDDYLVKGGSAPSYGSSGGGWKTVTADVLNVRDSPWGSVVAQYGYGQSVYIDRTVWSDGMEWGVYTSWSGYTRYISMDWLA